MSISLKPATTYSQQRHRLECRNVNIEDPSFCEAFLSRVNYYRFSGYILPFVTKPSNICNVKTSFYQLVSIYYFDTELRSLLSLTIEKIEIYLRTQIAYYHVHKYGPSGYMNASSFNRYHNHGKFTALVNNCIRENNNSPVVRHHIYKYGGIFPLWVLTDYFSLGMLSHFYTDMMNPDKAHLANKLYKVNYQVLSSWMRCLTDIRNRCAHYSRLYYWVFSAIPAMPKGDSFHQDRTLYSQLYMLKLMYPEPERWNDDFYKPFERLIRKYKPYIDLKHLGFPYHWKSNLK